MITRIAAAWLLAERSCAAIFEARIDVNGADRDVEALLRGSWIGSSGESLASQVHAAWLDSTCRALLRAVTNSRS